MTVPAGRVLVLGGTGFLGSHLVERLARGGTAVRVASARGRWPWGSLPAGVETTRFDLAEVTAPRDWDALIEGSPRIVNLAGVLQRPGRARDLYRRVHVDGPRHLLAAAVRAGVPRRIVHVSTTGVLGPTGPEPLAEDAPPRPATIYERTKAEGERLAREGRRPGLEVVVIRPGLVYGERDLHLLGLWRAIASATFRTIAGGRARWQPVHVDDVARALQAAIAAPGVDGEIFHVAGREVIPIAELAARIARLLGTAVKGPGLPLPLALAAGVALEALLLPFGIEPPLSPARVRTLTQDRLYRIDHVRDVLGLVPEVDLDAGLARAHAWYRSHGHL
ncbi:MAG TPA: NAD-dependent epimerase/dehydratase family protein [Candidatus Polarisedimenticolaceae bacterium]|nr:NAD-dependent epimerase/dehydratase family protein [Candidatus Polarisedimenticolaceae bacterium]